MRGRFVTVQGGPPGVSRPSAKSDPHGRASASPLAPALRTGGAGSFAPTVISDSHLGYPPRGLHRLVIGALCATAGCGLFSDRPYLVTELQVIAVVAEPPEVAADQPADLSAVVADPQRSAPAIGVTFSYCPQHDDWQNSVRCQDAATLAEAPD